MGQYRLNFVRAVVVEKGIRENDAASIAKTSQCGISLFAFLGGLPLIAPSHSRAGAFAKLYQPRFQIFILQRFELVENWKQKNRRKLGQQDEHTKEHRPGH